MIKTNRLLLLLIAFVCVCNLLWYFLGHKPLHWDSADHLSYSLETYKSFNSGASWFHALLDVSWYYPPFVYWTSIPFQMIFGRNEFAGFMQITFFLILLITSVFQIGKKIYNEEIGLFAAFCISMFPIVSEYGRDYMLDLPLAAMVAVAILSLIKTHNFSRTIRSINLGLVLGLGMLTKWTFILFIITPFVYYIFEGFKYVPKKSRVIINLLLTILTALIICLPWYIRNVIPILSNRLNELGRGDLSLVENVFYYLKIIPSQISIVLTILFLTGVILFFKRSHFLYKRMPVYCLIGSYVLITLINFKLPRFSIALLIPVSILFSGIVFYGENYGNNRNLFAKVFIGIAVINFLFFSFFPYKVNSEIPVIDAPVLANISPDKLNWRNADMIKTINEDRIKDKKQKVNLRVFPREENFNSSTLLYYSNSYNAPINMLGAEGFPFFTDYLVILEDRNIKFKENDSLPHSNELLKTFKELQKFEITKDLQVVLYKKNQDANFDLNSDSLKSSLTNLLGKFLIKIFKPVDKPKMEFNLGDSSAVFRGKIKSIRFHSDEAQLNKMIFRGIQYNFNNDSTNNESYLPVKNLEVELKDLEFNVNSFVNYGRIEILSLKEFTITSLEITPDHFKSYLEKISKGKVVIENVSFQNNVINFSGRYKDNYSFELALVISRTSDSNLSFKIEDRKLSGFSIPSWLLNFMLESYNPLIKGDDAVGEFRIGKFTTADGKIIIN